MSEQLPEIVVSILWAGVLAYAIFGGADFGSGFWDLTAGGDRAGAAPRARIDKSIGPVWEANHVWLIFVLVFLWTGFPEAFAAIARTLYLPLIAAATGIVFRGGAFAFRKSSTTLAEARFFGALFASSSVITPLFLGAAVGGIASGRVPLEGTGDLWTSWVNPTSALGGVLAVGTCAFLAAVFLTRDSDRDGQAELSEWFRRRALVSGVVVGAVALVGIAVLKADAPTLADTLLEGRGVVLVSLSGLSGGATMWALARRSFAVARFPAVAAVATIIIGWGVAQYPWVLVDEIDIDAAAASDPTLWGLLIAFGGAAALVIAPLAWMLRLSDTGALSESAERADSSAAVLERLRPDITRS